VNLTSFLGGFLLLKFAYGAAGQAGLAGNIYALLKEA
jgi:hypothetical protein